MLSKEKRSLFGGTLRCAGLAAAAALANTASAEFVPVFDGTYPNYSFNYGVGPAPNFVYHVFDFQPVFGAQFAPTLLTSNADGYLHAYANSLAMGAIAYAAPGSVWQYAGAGLQQFFTVSTSGNAMISWDLTVAGQFGFVGVYEFGVGEIFFQDAGTSGSMSLALNENSIYVIVAAAVMEGTTGETVYVKVTWVPAPGAVALFAIAGPLAAKRRRRSG